jgi:ubiquinone/menaquinone biosynthesis C-methylase UbiE
MTWYDVFSRFYDASLEPHYREQRAFAAEALDLHPSSIALDLPCGTGQSFSALAAAGRIIGVDLSAGMLRAAQRRIAANGWTNVDVVRADAATLSEENLGARPDRLHVFLGISVFSDPHAAFDNLWSLLLPGGRCVIVDVHAERLGMQGRMVNWIAQADITRRFWEPLEAVGIDFAIRDLPSKPLHGGTIRLATARKG